MEEKKKWWKSRTIWTNVVALVVLFAARQFGAEISPEETAGGLVIINMILRLITGTGLEK